MNDTYVGKHRDNSNAAWARCDMRDDRFLAYRIVEIPRHAKPVGGVA